MPSDPLRSPRAVALMLVAPFVLVFVVRAVVVSWLPHPLPLGDLPQVALFFGLFALGTSVSVPLVRRLTASPLVTALAVAGWYSGSAWLVLSGGRFAQLMPVVLFTAAAVTFCVWSALRR